ncbi:cobyric acid synthase [Pseudorhodoferax sp.]|jgi:adenosylcobyric acid synthase|uniref:cobyric acid synthase n=1 Tax=Pseudorhodoferax sp. TaxID=1993553 RepID=UPI002DD6457F|nr:cobyric acid synthase [Pseudorhodoferax sp.]
MNASPGKTLIVWGCSSGAGKSLVSAALCRWAANAGLDVAPFKAQNMSNNARVVAGGEIGSAQYFQALAARVAPGVDMNPVLLKPERDTASQVVLKGVVAPELATLPWRERSGVLATAAREAFDRLAARHALRVVEGAGSPAEINLAPQDYVNLGVARWARAQGSVQALLVADIDRGGAFAHLYGTWSLLPEDLRPLLAGFLLNKFRGDAGLLAPGPEQLRALCGVPLLGVLPMLREHGLPEEDGLLAAPPQREQARLRVAVLAPPALSNHDEFQPLLAASAVQLVWARRPAELSGADLIVLPGSKQVNGDLAWLRAQGFEAPLRAHAAAGKPLLGLCGGLQMLGEWLDDPEGVDGQAHGPLPGLGLLPIRTRYAAPKRVRASQARFAAELPAAWSVWAGLRVPGYEIRCGRTEGPGAVAWADDGQPLAWAQGSVLGLYLHGALEQPALLRALCGAAVDGLDAVFDRLAEHLEGALGRDKLMRLCTP